MRDRKIRRRNVSVKGRKKCEKRKKRRGDRRGGIGVDCLTDFMSHFSAGERQERQVAV